MFNVFDKSVFKRICLALLTSLCLMPFDRCVCVCVCCCFVVVVVIVVVNTATILLFLFLLLHYLQILSSWDDPMRLTGR